MAPVAANEHTTTAAPCPQHVVVVGLGMVAISFIEKLLKYDDQVSGGVGYRITVVGDEPHIAYNRVGLTQYFRHRSISELYLSPLEWYSSHRPGRLTWHTGVLVERIDTDTQQIFTSKNESIDYDTLVLATGSHGALPPYLPPARLRRTEGAFVYRTVDDLDRMIKYAREHKVKKAMVVGGGLLGLEAAKALLDLEDVDKVGLVERNEWVLSRQLDSEGGGMVLERVRALDIEVLVKSRIKDIFTTLPSSSSSDIANLADNTLEPSDEVPEAIAGIILEDDTVHECQMITFAIGIKPRDELAMASGIVTHHKGGIVIGGDLATSAPNVYAIGECASWNGETYGIISPGTEMAEVLAFNLTQVQDGHKPRSFERPDMSTRLKLMGVDVASFGDYFADRKKPGDVQLPKRHGRAKAPVEVKALHYRDPFAGVYKKYLFTADGKYLLGGMMVGDVKGYEKLVGIVKKQKPLDTPPGQLILGSPQKEGEEEGDDLDDDAQICACHNVLKKDIKACVKDGCTSFGELKSKTKVATGCGGCAPLATAIFKTEMKRSGHTVTNHLCTHFKKSRQDLFNIAKFKKLRSFAEVMREAGENPDAIGCEACKPTIGSILASLHNEFILGNEHRQLQDTNDKYLANMQKNGTYSVVPRIPAGEITPEKLVVIGEIGKKYNLYTKITGGQRIDLFGAEKQDLPEIWEELGKAGFESGHAYGKALRTVKSCVGTNWCRYGVGDSVGFALELENRYKGIRSPHKLKGGASGCVRECSEAQSKDFGVIATTKGWNVFIGGNGGAQPRHAELLASDVPRQQAVRLLDRFLMLYITSADKLQRTARWVESLAQPGQTGLSYIKDVIVKDSLGICKDLDKAMDELVGTYHDEWAVVVNDPKKRALFRQFANSDERKESGEFVLERGQRQPAADEGDGLPKKLSRDDVPNAKWEWRTVARVDQFPVSELGVTTSMAIKYSDTQIAVFRLANGELHGTQQVCPHRRAFVISDGLIGDTPDGRPYVSCPLHKRNYALTTGECLNDDDYRIMTFEAKEENGNILLRLPEPEELDGVLGTSKWMIRQAKQFIKSSGAEMVEVVGPVGEPEAEGNCESKTCGGALDW